MQNSNRRLSAGKKVNPSNHYIFQYVNAIQFGCHGAANTDIAPIHSLSGLFVVYFSWGGMAGYL